MSSNTLVGVNAVPSTTSTTITDAPGLVASTTNAQYIPTAAPGPAAALTAASIVVPTVGWVI